MNSGCTPRPVRVLVVDDDAGTVSSTADRLALLGVAVTCAGAGAERLRAAEDGRADVLVTDLRAPRCSGLELARRVKQLGRPPRPHRG